MVERIIPEKMKKKKILIIGFIAIILLCSVIWINNITAFILETEIRFHYNFWNAPKYDSWICQDFSEECEKYFETHGYPCYFVYGDKNSGTDNWTAHIWNIVMVNGEPFEFESTSLTFKKVSQEYNIQHIQEGFYVNGVKYEKSQELENWEELEEKVGD